MDSEQVLFYLFDWKTYEDHRIESPSRGTVSWGPRMTHTTAHSEQVLFYLFDWKTYEDHRIESPSRGTVSWGPRMTHTTARQRNTPVNLSPLLDMAPLSHQLST